MLSVTVLGSSAMYATVERACAGYLLEVDKERIWLDAGGGSWRNLLAACDYQDLDGIVLTHRHPDHTVDLFQAFHARRYGAPEAMPKIPLWAPGETLERAEAFSRELHEAFDLTAVAAGHSLEIGGAKFSFFEMAHPPETVGVRIESGGAVLAYSADTGLEADFEGLAGNANLFICEATFQESDEEWEGHLRASDAGRIAADVGVKNLLLTHLPPGRDLDLTLVEAQKESDGINVALAVDRQRLEV